MTTTSPVAPAGRPLEAGGPGTAPSAGRLDSVDFLRGLVMVIMALDHVRDYFSIDHFDPTNLSLTTPALFFTRWITHFCAPVFVFLAGTGAFLATTRGKSRGQLAWFLFSRGLWLVVLEVTVVRFAWTFNLNYQIFFVQVIWAIGWSMVLLAGLIYLPRWALLLFAVATIAGHNFLDPILPDSFGGHGPFAFGALGWAWIVLHVQYAWVAYPLVPWVGVIAAGYAFGPILMRDTEQRRKALIALGLSLTAAFVILRGIDAYGDPTYWHHFPRPIYTVMSFLNTTKYPPSLLYLLMTLGPAIAALAYFERLKGPVARFFVTFGRVPLFYYLLHLYLVHVLVLITAALMGRNLDPFLNGFFLFPSDWGFSLPVVYVIWIGVVLTLYPACRWFAALKARRKDAWLSYL